ncbi:sigma-70 family RNA polymerase sigma factor [Mumia zhuanghuii]|uniref:Sigma-70 family RNA polymerase sigma factor n=1 Tax=Mumia zhuanghuii TaxID=2585211 RepID=A0A5C4MG84_9ACTN|nr:sigma-70 family RNA polymerase sigma factor [Mumia zhuanghuii]TNC39175.1 sigma-70 family RNA polymerase sigma factor [Mumia zhuanghuii]TNC42903.1 sigma-70 family RNA polymerase sigma factor [Mumia zhuanghuii]
MTDFPADPTVPSDAELISAVRAGDNDAYGALFERHRDAARRMALQLVTGPDADDLVSEAFIKVLDQLRAGAGPDIAFRAYLLTAIRRLHIDRIRAERRVQPTDDLEKYDGGVEFDDTAVAAFESSAAARAFGSLPERWQLALWHLDVEGAKPADIAPMLGMTANGVSALAYRAREGLRQSYLQLHLSDTAEEQCRWTTEHLGAYVRQGLGKRDTARVRDHLDECARCTAVYLELVEVNSGLRGLLAPLLLGAAGAGYVAAMRGETAAVAGAGGGAGGNGGGAGGSGGSSAGGGVVKAAGRARDWVMAAPSHGLAAAGVTVGIVGAVVASTLLAMTLGSQPGPTSDEASDGPRLELPGPPVGGTPLPGATPGPETLPGPAAVPPGVNQPAPFPPAPDPVPSLPDAPGADDPEVDEPGPDAPEVDEPDGPRDPGDEQPAPNEPNEPGPTEPTPTEPTEPPPTPPTAPPTAPTALAISDDPDGVTLRWGAVTGATGYEVYRAADTGAGAGRFSVSAAVTGDLISGPEPITALSYVDADAPNGGRVLYEVVAVGRGGRSEAASVGPLTLPSTGRLSVRPIGLGLRCLEVRGRAGSASIRLTADCSTATTWRVWGGTAPDGWVSLKALSGPSAGSCLASAATPLISTVTMVSCDAGAARQKWDLDPSDDAAQQVAARARPGQVLDATVASVGGLLLTAPRIRDDRLDRNQRFTFSIVDGRGPAR